MGNCVSTQDREALQVSQAIDKQIEEDYRKYKKECKILLLGSGESGKSTIVKQMKIIHQNGYNRTELMTYRTTIYKNLLESAHNIILAMRKIGVDCVNPENRARTERILDYAVLASPTYYFDEEMARAIYDLWLDPIISTVMDHSSEFYLMDSAA